MSDLTRTTQTDTNVTTNTNTSVNTENKIIISHTEVKVALKEALKEWLDEKFTVFGKWSFRGLASASLFALVYFVLTMNGWKH